MKRVATQIALVALLGSMAAISPGWAAPGDNGPVNCRDPAMAKTPACMQERPGHRSRMHSGDMNNTESGGNNTQGGKGTPNSSNNNNTTTMNQGGSSSANDNGGRGGRGDNDSFNGRGDNRRGDNGPSFNDRGRGDNGPSFNDRGRGDHGPRSFNDFRRHFDFPRFARPDFTVRPGFVVPRHFGLRPLPPQIFGFYPRYRGYLYFITPGGNLVIVNPRTLRIVAIL